MDYTAAQNTCKQFVRCFRFQNQWRRMNFSECLAKNTTNIFGLASTTSLMRGNSLITMVYQFHFKIGTQINPAIASEMKMQSSYPSTLMNLNGMMSVQTIPTLSLSVCSISN